jgi:hypothetical protein
VLFLSPVGKGNGLRDYVLINAKKIIQGIRIKGFRFHGIVLWFSLRWRGGNGFEREFPVMAKALKRGESVRLKCRQSPTKVGVDSYLIH